MALCLMASCIAMAQKVGEQAIFAECRKEELPVKCTEDKITADISALLTGEIIAEIEKSSSRKYFTVSVEFISDENGMIIPSETGIMCENNATLQAAIENYLNNLPPFIPKDKKIDIRKSYTVVNIVYVQNTDNQNYHTAGYNELLTIKGYRSFGPSNAPVYPGCENAATNKEKMACLASGITKSIAANYVMPTNIKNAGQDKMHISMIITLDGKLRVEEIAGSSVPFRNEVYRAIKKVPKIKPAEEKGIPVSTHLLLPLTLNVK